MTPGRAPIDFPSLAGPVARALLGDPNPKLSTAAELRYGEHGRLSVRLSGERAGQWYDFAAGRGGGVLDLVARVRGGDRAAAVRWLDSKGSTDPLRRPGRRGEGGPAVTACGAGEGRGAAQLRPWQSSRRDCARRLWDSTRPIAGTVAAAYLDARGVGHVAGAPALRFHPGITHPNESGRLPALVAGIQDAGGRFVGIQRTYLNGPRKAALDPVRASLGSLAGGAVRLVPVTDDVLLLGEGIESTAAAVRVLDWPGGAWATLGTSGLRSVVLPASVRRVVVAADRDVEGAAQKAAATLARRLKAEGRRVECWLPFIFGDFNDELMAMGRFVTWRTKPRFANSPGRPQASAHPMMRSTTSGWPCISRRNGPMTWRIRADSGGSGAVPADCGFPTRTASKFATESGGCSPAPRSHGAG